MEVLLNTALNRWEEKKEEGEAHEGGEGICQPE